MPETSNAAIEDILQRIRERARARAAQGPEKLPALTFRPAKRLAYDISTLRQCLTECKVRECSVGTINPRRPGLLNDAIQLVKRLLARCLGWYTRPLLEYHAALARTLGEIENLFERVIREQQKLHALAISEQQKLQGAMVQAGKTQKEVRHLRAALSDFEAQFRSASAASAPDLRTSLPMESPSRLHFDYVQFEERFRGPQDLIRERQSSYLPYFRGLQNVADLGCGRGEFLGLLRDQGIPATGVESDPSMAEVCRQHGFQVAHQDLLTYLESQADGALDGIFCSQVIEHMPASRQLLLVELAYRKLRPGGVAVLETINPECVYALVRNFFLDPTHVRPVHPEMLQFALESRGFGRVELKFSSPVKGKGVPPLPGPPDPATASFNDGMARLNAFLYGYQDYAAIAWR